MHDDSSNPIAKSATVKLFPLPNVVLYPQVLLPLHIFEPRYRQMTADALEGDRLITIVLLRPGWEEDYEGRPALHPVGCVGRIVAEQQLLDGRYNLMLRGVNRVRIDGELELGKPYRLAKVDRLDEPAGPEGKQARELVARLRQHVLAWFTLAGPAKEHLAKLFEGDLAIGTLCDVLSFALPLAIEFKQRLLEEVEPIVRVRELVRYLESTPPPSVKDGHPHKFPPEFSTN